MGSTRSNPVAAGVAALFAAMSACSGQPDDESVDVGSSEQALSGPPCPKGYVAGVKPARDPNYCYPKVGVAPVLPWKAPANAVTCPTGYRQGGYPDNESYCYLVVPPSTIPRPVTGCPSGYGVGAWYESSSLCYALVPPAVIDRTATGCPASYRVGSYPDSDSTCVYVPKPRVVEPLPGACPAGYARGVAPNYFSYCYPKK